MDRDVRRESIMVRARRRRSLRRSISVGCGWGAVAGLMVCVVAALGGWDPRVDGEVLAGISIVLIGAVFGAVVGAVRHGIAVLAGSGVDEVSVPGVPVADPWGVPVARCERSAEAVVRLLDTLPASVAAEWLRRIAEDMAEKLAELGTLADAGRAAVPIVDRRSVRRVRRHPLYGILAKTADEFALTYDQISSLVVELHAAPDFDEVKAQLEVLTEQLPWLRPAA